MTRDCALNQEKKKKILVIEDEPDILESIEATLTHVNFQVQTLSRGDQVKNHVLENHPGLILLDVMIPKPDGYQLCHELKSDAGTQGIPIILLSARGQKEDIERGFKAGANRYIVKPFLEEELIKTIRQLLAETEKEEVNRWPKKF